MLRGLPEPLVPPFNKPQQANNLHLYTLKRASKFYTE